MYIKDSSIVGKTFYGNDPKCEYTCIGYADNGTLLIIGAYFDSVNNRSKLKTFKLTDVTFKGQVS